MAIDTPARLAVLGAGPVGLEAALYARFLGYDVVVYERGSLAASVRARGHVRMFAPFGMNRTTLGLAAIEAQDEAYRPPADEERLVGHEWIERYLAPLAATDLVSDHLRLNTTVLAVGKEELSKGDTLADGARGDWSFRVLSRSADGRERVELFDGVLDCTGVSSNANWLGPGGIPAIGEQELRGQIEYGLPDILGSSRERYAGKQTLLIGGGMSAATNAVALWELARADVATKVTWLTRREGAAGSAGPITVLVDDPLPGRTELARQANGLFNGDGVVTHWPCSFVERIDRAANGCGFVVQVAGRHAGEMAVDQIIANVGYRPDHSLYEELQVERRDFPSLSGGLSHWLSGEPNYYILGSKSRGRCCDLRMPDAHQQVREVFKIIGDREGLDLYASARKLLVRTLA